MTIELPFAKCPVCEGVGSYMLRIGTLQRVQCMRCKGTGRIETESQTAPAGTDAGGLGHEVTEPHSPPRSAGATDPCSEFVWSAELPKRSGWWWVEDSRGARFPIYVSLSAFNPEIDGTVELNRRLVSTNSRRFKRWAGPLPEPLEPSARNLESHPQSSGLSDRRVSP